MYGHWHQFGICPCGEHAILDGLKIDPLFHMAATVCPKCGLNIEKNWRLVVMRRVSAAVWWKPWTWGNGYWEERKPT